MPDFLLEVGLEEIPARMIADAQTELARRVVALLTNARLLAESANGATLSYSTPRRITVTVSGISEKQGDISEQVTGPSWKVAFKDDQPTQAAIAFAKKAGVGIAHLEKVVTAKGEYVAATVHRSGRSASEILNEHIPKVLTDLYWPKNMYWRPGKPERFVRPLRWLLALLDDEVVPVEFAGITASNFTYGHRILHGDAPIRIANPAAYLPGLESAYVLADVEGRRQKIRKALDAAARAIPNARWREDYELVDTVTHLTEWPGVVFGSFEDEYLTLPEEVLVTVMRDHQKYFAVEDGSGNLAAHFLAVLNTESDDAGLAIIRHGNERVLRARFNDARFFWNADQKIPLTDRVEMLKAVTFQKELGSYYDKTDRNRVLARRLGSILQKNGLAIDLDALDEASRLSKTDLTTELVKEFTELQGIVGGLYARAQGHAEVVAESIYWQYRPTSMEDAIPPTAEGQVLGLADRLSTIVDMFAIGLEPTGSKDPFALRRAGNGVIRILAESPTAISMKAALLAAITTSAQIKSNDAVVQYVAFFRDRLNAHLRDNLRFRYDVVEAVLGTWDSIDKLHFNIPAAVARAVALTEVRGSDDFAAIAAAVKRMKNILRQAAQKEELSDRDVQESLLLDAEEKALFAESKRLESIVERLRAEHKYPEALELIATLRPHVDRFFDAVMVMDPDAELRQNRLALLGGILEWFSRIADFSELVPG